MALCRIMELTFQLSLGSCSCCKLRVKEPPKMPHCSQMENYYGVALLWVSSNSCNLMSGADRGEIIIQAKKNQSVFIP